jgi:hypothetical protein
MGSAFGVLPALSSPENPLQPGPVCSLPVLFRLEFGVISIEIPIHRSKED